jgi:hypothetical protein
MYKGQRIFTVYLSRLRFHPLNHNHDTKYEFMCHSVPVFLRARFNPQQYAMPYKGATKPADYHTLVCTQTCIISGKC